MVGPGAVVLGAVAGAFPPAVDQAALLEEFFVPRSPSPRLARAAFAASGVERRHAVVDPRVEDCSSWSTGRRMERFASEAPPLAARAVAAALRRAGVAAGALGLLAVVSCTGYSTPGVDALVARELGCAPGLRRLLLGHVGCHGALPALAAAADFVAAHGKPAAVCCLELPSLHAQPADGETGQLAVHALFGDAAAAAVLQPPEARGLELVGTATLSELAGDELLTWTVTDLGFRMTLSRALPQAVGSAVGPLVERLLAPRGLTTAEVAHWVVHPGGPRVLDAVAGRLGLAADALACSRAVLERCGNCSSATVLLVLEALLAEERPAPGDHVAVLAFGPGLTLEGALLRAR